MQKYRTLLVREQLSKEYDGVIGAKTDTPHKVYEIMKLLGAHMQPEEHLWVVHLNCQQKITGVTEASIGALTASVADPAVIYRTAILAGSAAIILVHNHPSGDTTPSQTDYDTTERLKEVGKLIGIPVVDHIVIGDSGYTAMSDSALFNFI